MRLNGNMATEVAKEAFLPALKYGASSPTRCEEDVFDREFFKILTDDSSAAK